MRGIYKITNKANGKVYIGESLDIERRWKEHLWDLTFNNHHSYKLQEDWNTYGGASNFEFEVVELLEDNIARLTDKCVLIIYEYKYMKKYDSLNNGYNCENTFIKLLNGEKALYGKEVIDRNSKAFSRVLENIKENDGVYIVSEKALKQRDRKSKKKNGIVERKYKKVLPISEISTGKYYIKYDKDNNIIKRPLTVLKNEFYSEKYVCCNLKEIYELLRNKNILFLDDRNHNMPYKEYISDGYFEIESFKDNKIIVVTNKGKELIKNILIEEEYMIIEE